MTRKEKIIDEVLKMPAHDRALIAEQLISSLDATVDDDVESAWQEEIKRRLDAFDKGQLQTISWEEVQKNLKNKFPCS